MSNYKIRRRLTSALLVLCMSAVTPVTVLADPTDDILLDTVDETDVGMVYQDDSYDEMIISEPADDEIMPETADEKIPAPIADKYVIDGVTYYKVDTNQFSESEIDFYRDMINGQMKTAIGSSGFIEYDSCFTIKNLWIKIAGAILRKFRGEGYGGDWREDKMLDAWSGSEKSIDTYCPNPDYHCHVSERFAPSLKEAEKEIIKSTEAQFPVTLFDDEDKYGSCDGPTFYSCVSWVPDQKKDALTTVRAVVLTDFKVSPLIPEDSDNNYVTIEYDCTEEGKTEATDVVNDTALSDYTGTQEIKRQEVKSVKSEITGSKSYEFGQSLTVGATYGFSEISNAHMDFTVSATEAVNKGWTKGEEESEAREYTNTVSATMKPYTGLMMKQTKRTIVAKEKYNCPVALTYRVLVLHYDFHYNKNGQWEWNGFGDRKVIADFGVNSRKDLYDRYIVDGHNKVDRDGIDWTDALFTDNNNYVIPDMLRKMATMTPIASTEAVFKETLVTYDDVAENLMPTSPLKYVLLKDQKDEIKLNPNDTLRLDKIKLEGLNIKKGPYFGFDAAKGKWILTDEDGKELTDGSIATLTKNKNTGSITFKAVAPGTVLLKYLIHENVYGTFDNPTVYATNASLGNEDTIGNPVIEVTIEGVPVTGVTLDKDKVTIAEGQTDILTATVAPENASDKNVSWKADDTAVAAVSDGTVSGVAAGKTKVTVTTTDGGKTAKADVIVKYATPKAAQNGEKLTGLIANAEYKINGTKYTADASGTIPVDKAWHDKEITIVRVNSDADLNSDEQKLMVVEKPVPVEGVTLDPAKLTISEGQTGSFTVVITPEEATNKDVTWTIADPKVATVADGTVTGIAAGKTKVTATTIEGEKTATGDVIVKYATPAAVQKKENLTGLVANGEYKINNVSITADDAGTIPVNEEWYDKEITIIRVNSDAELSSDEQILKVKDPSKKDPTPKPSGLISMKEVKINGFKNSLPYTGEAVKQNATLTYGSGKTKVTLVEDKDYTVTYKNNYDLGTATVIYEATDDEGAQFTDSVEKTFSITGKYTLITDGKDENCTITLASDEYAYANGPIKPEVTVTAMLVNNNGEIEERILTPGKDYAVSYKNNKNVAAADAVNSKNGKDVAPQVIIKGKGKYEFADTEDMKKGAVKRFAITQCDISELVFTVNDVIYNKKANKYKNTKIQFFDNDYKDLKLKVNKDYTVEYETSDDSDAPQAGQTVTVTITAAKDKDGNYSGNYEGTATATYRVVDNKANINISKAKVIVNPDANGKAQTCAYTGEAIEPGQDGQPALKVVIGSGKNAKTLTLGEEFEIVGYYNNIKAGNNAVLLVKGKDTYYGTKAVKFKIK